MLVIRSLRANTTGAPNCRLAEVRRTQACTRMALYALPGRSGVGMAALPEKLPSFRGGLDCQGIFHPYPLLARILLSPLQRVVVAICNR